MNYSLAEIFDIDELKRLCESFTDINGTGTAIVDLDGNVLVATGWQPVCTQFHRVNSQTKQLCSESDTILASQISQGQKYNAYKCKNGLVDVAMPIVVGDKHIGNFFIGQFFSENPDLDFFRRQAARYGFNEAQYMAAIAKVPVFDEKQVKANITFLVQITEIIGSLGLKKLNELEQKRKIELEKQDLQKNNEELNQGYQKVYRELVETKEYAQERDVTYRMLFQNLTSGFALHEIILDDNGLPCDYRFLEVNPAFEELTGLKAANIIGKTILSIMPNTERSWIETYGQVALTGKVVNFENYSQEINKYYQVTAYSPEPGKFATVFLDITQRKQAEEMRQKFVMLADSSSEFIGMCDLELNPIYVNRAGIRMVGLPDFASACKVKVQDYFFPEDQRFIAEEFFPRVLRDGDGSVEIRLRHFQTGEPVWVYYNLFSLRDASGKVVGWATVSRDITERKRAEDIIRQERSLIEAIFESIPGVLYVYDDQLRLIRWNKKHETETGYSSAELEKRVPTDWYSPEEMPMVARAIEDVKNKGYAEMEAHVLTKDGRNPLMHSNAVRLILDGRVYFVGIGIDITERKLAEEALRESRATLKLVLDTIPQSVFWKDRTGRYLGCNKVFAAEVGYDNPDMVVGKTDFDLFALENDALGYRADDKAVIESNCPKLHIIEQLQRANGSRIWIDTSKVPLCDASGRLFGVLGVCEDITERRNAEERINKLNMELEQRVQVRTEQLNDKNRTLEQTIRQLQETQRQLILFEKLTVLRHLISGIAHEINNPLGAIDSSRELIDMSVGRLVHNITRMSQWLSGPEGELFAEFIDKIRAGVDSVIGISSREKRQRRSAIIDFLKNYDVANAQDVGTRLATLNVDGDLTKYIPLFRHEDILDMLNGVSYITDSFLACRTIKMAVDKSARIVNALRGYVKKDGNWEEKTLADIREGMGNVLLLFQNVFKNFVTLELDMDEDLPQILCYPDQLNQVWTNIIQNALYAMNNTGKLVIVARQQDSGIIVSITDHGCGMTPEVKARVFEPLFTTKPEGEGIGLGMDIVHMIVTENHGGRINIESELGKGTTVSVWLPVGGDQTCL